MFEEAFKVDRTYNAPPVFSARKRQLLAWFFAGSGASSEAIELCRSILAGQPGLRPALETGAILAQAGDVKTARQRLPKGVPVDPPNSIPHTLPNAARQLVDWPVYFRRIVRLWAEIALAEDRPRIAFQLISGAPPPEAIQEWPDTLIRASIRSGERVTAVAMLTELFSSPAAYWFAPDNSPAGFLRRSVAQARALNMPATSSNSLEVLLDQNTE